MDDRGQKDSPAGRQPAASGPASTRPAGPGGGSTDVCPVCSESAELALIKGCLRCLKCGFKWDCNGW